MGLLDFNFDDPDMRQGLLSAGAAMMKASGNRRVPISFIEGLGEGLSQGMQGYQQSDLLRRKKEEDDLARQMEQMKMQEYQRQIQQEDMARKQMAQRKAMMPQILQRYGSNLGAAVRDGVLTLEEAKGFAEAGNLGRQKVARVEDIAGANGQKQRQMFDEYGNRVGDAMSGYVAPQLVNTGDSQRFVTPMAGQSFTMGMSPADKAAAFRADRAYNQSERQFKETQNKPIFNAELGGFVSPTNGFMPVQGIGQRAPKMTEDQSKATGWLVQAENAWKNMQAAGTSGKDAQGNFIVKDAAKPGFNDVLAGIPSFGFSSGVANVFRGADRQKFMQSASSLSESLLRAATGAGVNKEEAAQKIAELTPQIGDSDEVTQQKMNAIPLYIESLKVRSGAGANQAESIFKNNEQKSGRWSIQKVN